MKKPAAVGPRHGGVGHVQEVGEIAKRPASGDIDDAEKSDASDESGVGAWREFAL